jgi:hypothetical protein
MAFSINNDDNDDNNKDDEKHNEDNDDNNEDQRGGVDNDDGAHNNQQTMGLRFAPFGQIKNNIPCLLIQCLNKEEIEEKDGSGGPHGVAPLVSKE